MNLGDGNNLEMFLEYSKDTYPAEHYALFLGGHGLAIKGSLPDAPLGDEDGALSASETRKAIAKGMGG